MWKSKRNILSLFLVLVAFTVLLYRENNRMRIFIDSFNPQKTEYVQYQRNTDEKSDLTQFSFAIIGDSGEFINDKAKYLSDAVQNIKATDADLVFAMGNMVPECKGDQTCQIYFNLWKKYMDPLLSVTYGVVGNHDRSIDDKADKIWWDEFDFPVSSPDGYDKMAYSFNFGNSHFVVLDTEKPKEHNISDEQLDWLDYDLSNNDKENTFVFFHEPAYPVSSKKGDALDANPENRERLWIILDSHNVRAVFNGHEQIFSRRLIDSNVFPKARNSIYQFIVGNTDAPVEKVQDNGTAEYTYSGHHYVIVDVDGDNITVNLYATNGKFIDSFNFSK